MPELRVDAAIVNGPLPVMTLFTKTLWRGTPHGFDEALPKGHEDWSFWLQLTRLPLQAGEIATPAHACDVAALYARIVLSAPCRVRTAAQARRRVSRLLPLQAALKNA